VTQSAPAFDQAAPPPGRTADQDTVFAILIAISFSHLLNDMLQALLPAIYPMLKDSFTLTFSEIGLLTLTYQLTASILQPVVGLYTDHRPKTQALAVGMTFTMAGLLTLAFAPSYHVLLLAALLMGLGSSIFHPESSRVARLASGGRHGFAQSVFQVGGNLGSAIGPLLAAFFVLAGGQASVAWFALAALLGIVVLWNIGRWYRSQRKAAAKRPAGIADLPTLARSKVAGALAILIALMFSKFFYLASISSYYTFYLIHKFGVSVQTSQIYLFVFLGAVAVGTIAGGPIGDRFGRKPVIWFSILGALPFTLALPYADLTWTAVLSIPIGLILASAFSVMVVYAQELVPGKVGAISGLFFGLAFGMGGVGAAVLGGLADITSIEFVYRVCSYLPAIGLLAAFLPSFEPRRKRAAR
jgi:FSR family fosmidomycin resistance protein-like MFS transporter